MCRSWTTAAKTLIKITISVPVSAIALNSAADVAFMFGVILDAAEPVLTP